MNPATLTSWEAAAPAEPFSSISTQKLCLYSGSKRKDFVGTAPRWWTLPRAGGPCPRLVLQGCRGAGPGRACPWAPVWHHAVWVRPPQADLSTEPPWARALPSARGWGQVLGTFTWRSQRTPTEHFHMRVSANWKDVGMFVLD